MTIADPNGCQTKETCVIRRSPCKSKETHKRDLLTIDSVPLHFVLLWLIQMDVRFQISHKRRRWSIHFYDYPSVCGPTTCIICHIFTKYVTYLRLPESLWSYYIYDMSHVYEICDIFTKCVTYLWLSECLWSYYTHDMWHIHETCDILTKSVTHLRSMWHIYEICDTFTKHVTYWRKMWHIYDYQSVCGPTHGSCCGMSQRGGILKKDEPYWQLPKCVWSHPRILFVQRCPAWLKLHQNPRLSQFCYPLSMSGTTQNLTSYIHF